LHALAAAFVLPAFFWAGRPPAPHTIEGIYRQSAIGVVAVLAVAWNFAYWFKGIYPRIYRLSPRVQAETGARVIVKGRSGIAWDRPVGWQASIGLQVRFLGLFIAAFGVWGLSLLAVIFVIAFLHDGPAGVLSFVRR
jgi:hypothetical protein